MLNLKIRQYRAGDETELSNVICRCLREINSFDYGMEEVESIATRFTPKNVSILSKERNFFVATINQMIVGTASIAIDNRPNQQGYICLTAFVSPDWHGRGVGTKLMSKIENTARGRGASSIQVPSSITALNFYKKLGYALAPNSKIDPEDVTWLIKHLED